MILGFGSIPVLCSLIAWMCRSKDEEDIFETNGREGLVNGTPVYRRHSSSEFSSDFEDVLVRQHESYVAGSSQGTIPTSIPETEPN